MKKSVLLIFLLSISAALFAQSSMDTIAIERSFWGTYFIKHGKALRPRQLLDLTKANPEAYGYMQKAKTNYDLGFVLGFVGGFLVGYPLGTAIAGRDANWTLAGIGAGLIVLSMPLSAGYTKNAKKAVLLYNGGLQKTGLHEQEIHLRLDNRGIGLRFGF